MKIYVDLDGVLADFDKAAEVILGTDNIYKYEFVWGADKFWEKLNAKPYFFRDLPKKHDADRLWDAISHLKPVILTALPRENGERVAEQKNQWVRNFVKGRPQDVITCATKDKPNYCKPGDILIDDRAVNRDAWIGQGGMYLIHTDAGRTVAALKALGII
ncbi:5' nucleotidase, NT5C type [Bradyrhizobium sp. USDA 4350]